MGHKKYAQTQGNVMLKFFNANQKNFSRKLETILDIRKQKQKNNSFIVKKILFDVKNKGDKAVIKYEKKFTNIKSKQKKLSFLKKK